MRQRALKAGVLANPYRFIDAGQEFDHHERMNWAEPADDDLAGVDPAADDEPEQAAPTKRRKRTEASQPAGSEADPI